jgi:hypothetical protein
MLLPGPSLSSIGTSRRRTVPAPLLLLDAGAGVTTSGGAVTAWADQSGNGRDGTPHGSPTLTAGAINGLPAVTFASPAYFTCPSPGAVAGAEITLFVVARFASLTAGSYPRLADWGDGTDSAQLLYDADAGKVTTKDSAWQPDAGGVATQWYSPTAGAWDLIAVQWDATGAGAATLSRNGTAQSGSANSNTNVGSQDNLLYLGVRSGLNSVTYLAGDVAEVLCYGPLTPSQITSVTNALRGKYGL